MLLRATRASPPERSMMWSRALGRSSISSFPRPCSLSLRALLRIFSMSLLSRGLRTMTLDLERIEPYWVATHIVMENHRREGRTELQMHDIQVDTGLDEGMFDQGELTRIR